MAEYISRNDIKGTGLIFTGEDDMYTSAQADGADKMWNKILSLPTADVVEREKIDKAIEVANDHISTTFKLGLNERAFGMREILEVFMKI